jgi:hypothetical protein
MSSSLNPDDLADFIHFFKLFRESQSQAKHLGISPQEYKKRRLPNEIIVYVSTSCPHSVNYMKDFNQVKSKIEKLQSSEASGIGFPADFQMIAVEGNAPGHSGVPYVIVRVNNHILPVEQAILRDPALLYHAILELFYWRRLAQNARMHPDKMRRKEMYQRWRNQSKRVLGDARIPTLNEFERMLLEYE